jgi:hypothetical protein
MKSLLAARFHHAFRRNKNRYFRLNCGNETVTEMQRLAPDMASIELRPDNVSSDVWWLRWVEADEIVGRILQDSHGRCQIQPRGPRWSPMKSFGGRSFDSREAALAEVIMYFRGR